jgi:hypothetical protein
MSKPLQIVQVEIQRAEGPNTADFSKHIYKGEFAEIFGNNYLHLIAKTAPKGGGYDKTDVKITFENGRVWEARFEVKHLLEPDNDTDLRKHVRDFLFFHLNPEQIPWIQALDEPQRTSHIHSIRGMWTQEERAEAATFLAQIERSTQNEAKNYISLEATNVVTSQYRQTQFRSASVKKET